MSRSTAVRVREIKFISHQIVRLLNGTALDVACYAVAGALVGVAKYRGDSLDETVRVLTAMWNIVEPVAATDLEEA